MKLWTGDEVNSVNAFSLCFTDRIQITASNTQPVSNVLLKYDFKIQKIHLPKFKRAQYLVQAEFNTENKKYRRVCLKGCLN